MKKLLSVVTKVVKELNKLGYTFTSEENCEDSLDYLEIEGHEVIVGDDNNRESWNVDLRSIQHSDGTKVSFNTLTFVLTDVFGPPTKVHHHEDTSTVNNWKPVKDVIIVHANNSMEITQYYTKK